MMKDIALYDAECTLCQKSKKYISSFDWFNTIQWVPLQEYVIQHYKLSIDQKQLRKELHLLTHNRQILRGFYAVRRIMLRCPLLIPFGILAYLPFAGIIGRPLYRYIADRRKLFFKTECENGTCSIH
jgi:predicted DCC family thiol-disulfide oxidoreductase YuxK